MRKVSLTYRIEATSTPGDEVLRRVFALGAHAGGIAVASESTAVAPGGSARYSGRVGWPWGSARQKGLPPRNGAGHRARKRRCPTFLFHPEESRVMKTIVASTSLPSGEISRMGVLATTFLRSNGP